LGLLQHQLRSVLSPLCTHVKGRGGVKGTVRDLRRQVGSYRFVARFDIASYYDFMQHRTLHGLLDNAGVGIPLPDLERQYLEIPDLKHTGQGMEPALTGSGSMCHDGPDGFGAVWVPWFL